MTTLKLRQEKWDHWFSILDVDKDGILTVKDWILSADNFVRNQKLCEEDAKAVRRLFSEHAELTFGISAKGAATITRADFLKNLTQFYTKDPVEAKRAVTETFQKLAEIADQNKDGFMSEEEYVALNSSIGFKEEDSRRLYPIFGATYLEKGIPLAVFLEHTVEFALGGDETRYNRIEKHFPAK